MNSKITTIITAFVLLSFLVLYFYYFPLDITGKAIDEFQQIKTLHWTHMPLKYYIDSSCEIYERNKIIEAFDEIQNSTNSTVSFKETPLGGQADIGISCSLVENCYQEETKKWFFWTIHTKAICEHSTGKSQLTKIKGNKIFKAEIEFIGLPELEPEKSPYFSVCDNINTELHEILHAFNYQHKDNEESIMYPKKEQYEDREYSKEECEKIRKHVDEDIIEDLIKKYG